MIIYSKFHRIKQSQITRSQFSRHLPSTIFLHRPINPIRVPISHVRLFRTNTSINILHIAIMRVQRGRDPDINLKREDLSRSLALKENRPFPSFLRDAAAYDVLPPLSLCALHLAGSILRACANAHHARTHARLRCAGWVDDWRKGKREKGPTPGSFGRRICDVCLAGYIIGSRTMDIHFIWRLVGTLIFMLCSSVFGIFFITFFNACLFLWDLPDLLNC